MNPYPKLRCTHLHYALCLYHWPTSPAEEATSLSLVQARFESEVGYLTVGVRLPSLPFNQLGQGGDLRNPQPDRNPRLPVALGASSEHAL